MTAQDQFHLRAFRASLAHGGTTCEIDGEPFPVFRNRRKPVANPVMPEVAMQTPETFTAAAEDVGSLARQNHELRTATQSFRIIDVRREGPLLHIDCAHPTELT